MTTIGTRIDSGLSSIEDERGVTILYACESGSRAWGFESKDSDYDVRFIYVHYPTYYLSIAEKRKDTIEIMDENIDYVGWELRKALRLFRKSNPNLYEWLTSPVKYLERGPTYGWLQDIMPTYFSPRRAMYHYYHMARGNFRDYLQGDTVWTKKYFYVLRPILACLHIERGMGMPPVLFDDLVDSVIANTEVAGWARTLVGYKREGLELRHGPRVEVLHEFILHHLKRLESKMPGLPDAWFTDKMSMDEVFFHTLSEVFPYNWRTEFPPQEV